MAREVLSIVREISLEELRDAALRRPRLAVIGPSVEEARRAALEIFGPEARTHVVALSERDRWPDGAEVVLVDQRARAQRRPVGEIVVPFAIGDPRERILNDVFRTGDEIELRIGRTFSEVRQLAALHVIDVTSRANAQFALVSALPELIPVIGGVLAVGADTIVLTKNQLMMLYKLAAIHERDIDNRWRIYSEMLPIVGAAMFWRSLAGDLVALLPFAAGAIPKVMIAFTGTFAVGRAAHAYYGEGQKVSQERMREFYQEAVTLLRETSIGLPERARHLRLRERRHDQQVIEADYQFAENSPGTP